MCLCSGAENAAAVPQCRTLQPHIPHPCGTLSEVTAISSTDVWAVGANPNTVPGQPLIEHWDGKRWRIVPGAPRTGGALFAAAALAPRTSGQWVALGAGPLSSTGTGRAGPGWLTAAAMASGL